MVCDLSQKVTEVAGMLLRNVNDLFLPGCAVANAA